jgi:hypothetical protein
MDFSQAPYSVLKTFRIWLWIRWDIHDFLLTLRCHFTWELIFPILFTAENCDSPHHFCGKSLFVSIIYINSFLSLNTESQYSPYCLLRRVTTPRLIYSRESLLTAESYFQKIWRTPLSFTGTMKQKMDYPRTAHQEHFKRVKNMGYPRLCFLLLAVIDSRESIFW